MDASLGQLVSLGPVGVVLVVLGGAVWRIMVFLAGRLFNEDPSRPKGLIVRAVDAHVAALDQQAVLIRSLDERLGQLEAAVRQLATAQERLAVRHECHARPTEAQQ